MSWAAGIANMAEQTSSDIAQRQQQELLMMREENLARLRGEVEMDITRQKAEMRGEWSKVAGVPNLWQNKLGETHEYKPPRGSGSGSGSKAQLGYLKDLRKNVTDLATAYAEAEDEGVRAQLKVLLDQATSEYNSASSQFGMGTAQPEAKKPGFDGVEKADVKVGDPGTQIMPMGGDQPKPLLGDAATQPMSEQESTAGSVAEEAESGLWDVGAGRLITQTAGPIAGGAYNATQAGDVLTGDGILSRAAKKAGEIGYGAGSAIRERAGEVVDRATAPIREMAGAQDGGNDRMAKQQTMQTAKKVAPIMVKRGMSEEAFVDYIARSNPNLTRTDIEQIKSIYQAAKR